MAQSPSYRLLALSDVRCLGDPFSRLRFDAINSRLNELGHNLG